MNRQLASAFALLALASPAAAQTINVALNADIRSTNPGVNRDDNTDAVVLHMVEGLVGYRENGAVAPLLAEKIAVSADGLTYTFSLRKGVKFHNGAEMTSADVVWNWARYMEPKTDWRCRSEFDGRIGMKVTGVAAPDPSTFVMTLEKPSALFLDTMARTDCAMVAIIHKDSLKQDGSFDKPIGTGPFMLGDWRRGEFVSLKRFDAYVSPAGDKRDGYVGRKNALVPEVKFLAIADGATVKAGLISGALHVADIPDADMPEMRKVPNLQVLSAPSATKHALLLQTRDPLLGDVRMRQAIAAALDLDELVAQASNELGNTNNSAVYVSSPYYSEVQRQRYRHDPARVKTLLSEAGYKGQTIKLIANKRSTVPSFPVAIMAQAMLQAAGINSEIEVLEWATQLDRYSKGNYQMMSFSYSARIDPAQSYNQFSGPKDTYPSKAWDSRRADELIEKATITADEGERQKLFDELHKLMLADAPLIFLYNQVDTSAVSKRLSGFAPWVAGKPRLWEVSLAN
ncbi:MULTISPECIES: ABC transporter substrate-binding protein [unclassified Bosea (in: a-proteobacteria)]|uniref:ABC transporter substrate-binding protein n=1 Tax=unclassified Bosea (in: a-proteobacteria) TaxID=2653178 RepID=UPI000F759812|nr:MULTISPECIES: ABC transporter substrate-binding protein [unclassified Bosea (in: a-proteobacteria)]AZO80131.1 peptide ABC transporter substrate-binding protein [Bosea sp. Tri-49]RXT22918.1 peptide ABC transporter substrate-binding protein [Bosea sp. Tri-39]RXT38387.1 peptide ABC transporter substrate-binding protein [Bosea sp. Tri-54]